MNDKFDISTFVDTLTVPAAATKVVERMKVRRRAMKVSQQELARRSGVSYASIRRFETTGEIAFLSLLKIALALDCLEDFTSLFHLCDINRWLRIKIAYVVHPDVRL